MKLQLVFRHGLCLLAPPAGCPFSGRAALPRAAAAGSAGGFLAAASVPKTSSNNRNATSNTPHLIPTFGTLVFHWFCAVWETYFYHAVCWEGKQHWDRETSMFQYKVSICIDSSGQTIRPSLRLVVVINLLLANVISKSDLWGLWCSSSTLVWIKGQIQRRLNTISDRRGDETGSDEVRSFQGVVTSVFHCFFVIQHHASNSAASRPVLNSPREEEVSPKWDPPRGTPAAWVQEG